MEMVEAEGSLDYWRKFFNSIKSDIFELINKAILVAAEDFPKEFNDRRNMIVEKLYTCHLSLNNGGDEYLKEVKKSSNSNNPEENDQIVGEVMRIKEVILFNNQLDKADSDSILYESLRTLQQMQLSQDVLKTTKIGRTVCSLRKHNSSKIQKLARCLIDSWRVLVDECVNSAATITNKTATHSASMMDEKTTTTIFELGCSSKQTSEQKPDSHLFTGVKRKQFEEVSDTSKLENAKRKLHEGYQRIENAKKQRMIKIIEPRDIPKSLNDKRRSKKH